MFQHTAARRRLRHISKHTQHFINVSTHSRPKAAESAGGTVSDARNKFQHTAARRRLNVGITTFIDLI